MDELLRDFLGETGERLDAVDLELVRFEREPGDAEALASVFRLVHSIKGTCGFLGLPRLEAVSHAVEGLLGRFREGGVPTRAAVSLVLEAVDRIKLILAALDAEAAEPSGSDVDLVERLRGAMEAKLGEAPPTPAVTFERPPRAPTLRVGVEVVENLMTMVSELVLARNELLDVARRTDDSLIRVPLQRLSQITAELQDGVIKARMQPIAQLWRGLPRMVRDLEAELGKGIDLHLDGGDAELDRQLMEAIKDPLAHLVRNAAGHGLETAEERVAAGKPPRGSIRLTASHEGGAILIGVRDDGRGFDFAAIRRTALARGLVDEEEAGLLSEADLARFVFEPGFTTEAGVSRVSGRGVGLDVVKTNLEEVGGAIGIGPTPGGGVTVTLRLPLTLAIVSALLVEAGGQRFALPQGAVVEVVRTGGRDGTPVEDLRGVALLRLRERLIPLANLATLLGLEPAPRPAGAAGLAIVLRAGLGRVAFAVDRVLHIEDIVVKPLAAALRDLGYFSGVTILGEGEVGLILDPAGLARSLGHHDDAAPNPESQASPGPTSTAVLVLDIGPGPRVACPLALVARLEDAPGEAITRVCGDWLARLRGELVPLVPLVAGWAPREGPQPLVVLAGAGRAIAIPVEGIVDIVEAELRVEVRGRAPGRLGTATIAGQPVEVLDLATLLSDAFGSVAGRGEVLLVEPDPFFAALIMSALGASGYATTLARTQTEATALLGAIGAAFGAVIADLDHAAGREVARGLAPGGPDLILLRADPEQDEPEFPADGGRVFGKFDRIGLVAALARATSP